MTGFCSTFIILVAKKFLHHFLPHPPLPLIISNPPHPLPLLLISGEVSTHPPSVSSRQLFQSTPTPQLFQPP